MDDIDHAKNDKKLQFRSEVCTLSMRAREDWSSVGFELKDIRDAKMFAGEFKAEEKDLSAETIQFLFSVLEEICGELKKKHGDHEVPYVFGEMVSADGSSLMISLEEDCAQATIEMGWAVFIGKKEKKTKKTFKLDFAGNVDQEIVFKETINTLKKKILLLENKMEQEMVSKDAVKVLENSFETKINLLENSLQKEVGLLKA